MISPFATRGWVKGYASSLSRVATARHQKTLRTHTHNETPCGALQALAAEGISLTPNYTFRLTFCPSWPLTTTG